MKPNAHASPQPYSRRCLLPLLIGRRGPGRGGSAFRAFPVRILNLFRIRWPSARTFGFRICCGAILFALLLALSAPLALTLVPLPPALLNGTTADLELLDRHGRPLRAIRAERNPFHQSVQYADIPPALVQATLAAEDRRYSHHSGLDWRATARAACQLILHRRIVSGGSTITQQLIKLAEPRPRTFRSKLLEAIQALRLEQVWNKQQILAAYLDRLDYGNFNCGSATAAQFYFSKPLRDLSPAECALLAGLPQAPSRLNPLAHYDRAIKRQRWVLGQMHRAGWLADGAWQRALAEPLRLASRHRTFEAPHFVDLVYALHGQGSDFPSPDLAYLTNTRVTPSSTPLHTTLDLSLNRFAEQTLRAHLSRVGDKHVSNGAIVVLDNRSGDVLALVGSEDYFESASGQVNGAWAQRSVGSTFKPFTYLLALEDGATPATVVADLPTEFATTTGVFKPENYDRHCYGPMRYRVALANSLNISAVKVLATLGGPEPLRQLLEQCGLTTLRRSGDDYGLGLTIGDGEARLLELANAYACLARLGEYKPYRLLSASEHAPRSNAPREPPESRRVADALSAFLISDILSDNDARTLAFGAESALRFDFPVACKTGTSSDFRDNWAFGYTPEFTVGVWVGNFDGSAMRGISGVTGAAPVMHEIFEHLHQRFGTTWYDTPPGIADCWVHPVTGNRLNADSPLIQGAIREKFLATNPPPFESPLDYETQGTHPIVRLPCEYAEWLAGSDNWLGTQAVASAPSPSLQIVFPLPGTRIFLDADLPDLGRRLHVRASGSADLDWASDSLDFTHEGDRPIAWLTQGRHQITVRDLRSNTQATTWIEVVRR
jgi:penicillin-binding protein 1C